MWDSDMLEKTSLLKRQKKKEKKRNERIKA